MRKFIKEISALIATISVGTGAVTATALSEGSIDELRNAEASAEEYTPTAGIQLPPDLNTTTTSTMRTTTVGTVTGTLPGGTTTSIYTTTATIGTVTGTLPGGTTTSIYTTTATIGTMTGTVPNKTITTTTTTASDDIPMPPMTGDMAMPDGDFNGDGNFNIADLVSFQRYIINPANMDSNMQLMWYNGDLYNDSQLDVFDVVLMRRKLLNWLE